MATRKPVSKQVSPPDVLTISEAAAILGVSAVTLRRWDASGALAARRHPVSGRRIYRRADVMKLRRKIDGELG